MPPTFATAINCIDGRVQEPLISLIKERFKVDFCDMITEVGPDKVICEGIDTDLVESIKRRVSISLKKHNSKIIILAGHYDCAANPVSEDRHLKEIKEGVKKIKEWGLEAEIHGVWIDKDWKVRLVE